MASRRRDHLVDTALDLFCRDGFNATGIDRILAESGVAKMTLYKHFRSKDELILAALRLRDERFRNWFVRAVESRARDPRQRLLAIFDALEEWLGGEGFTGCAFINVAAEFTRRDGPVRAIAAEHKRLVFAYIRGLAEDAGVGDAGDAESLAWDLTLLAEGAIVMAHVGGRNVAAARARAAAEKLIAAAFPAAA